MTVLIVAPPADAKRTGALRTHVDMVVIHSTGGPKCDEKTNHVVWVKGGELETNMRFIEAHPVLGIHYMVGSNGELRRSVPENQIGHHVMGHSERSIAIELVNDGDGIDPFSDAQLQTLIDLLRDINKRWNIPRQRVVRHSDLDRSMLPCSPKQRRKVDPGPAFPYERVLDAVYSERQREQK
jgi:N-acetyl-anhydromuramyl-L-alanine amidase AmpD